MTGRVRWLRWLRGAARDLAAIIVTAAAIVVALREERPIFANQPSVVARLIAAAPAAQAVLAPSARDTTRADSLVATPQFAADRAAFAADLVHTGRMDQARADSLSYYAVREAYLDGVPPAVVFGVMLTENSLFVSNALSNVGAVGLMQVYPKIWLKALATKFGTNLAADSTNLKYGIYILSHYIKSDSGKVTSKAATTGLLHYNGCVKGTNTPNCHGYPGKVESYVERAANALCGDKTFSECIARPFEQGLFGRPATTTVAQAP
jgi:soluble lytic murein transglycosylase-like protein